MMSAFGLRLPLVVTLLLYLALLLTRNTRLFYHNRTLATVRNCCEERHVDISDSRLSNFGSDSDPTIDTREVLKVDRVIPLTTTLNRALEKITRKTALWILLENKKVLFLPNDVLNLTFTEIHARGKTEEDVFGMDAIVTKLDSLKRLGNAYIAENTDSTIVLVQKLRFQIMKYKYDYYDKELRALGSSSFIYEKNLFLLKIIFSTDFDNSNCKVADVKLTFAPDSEMYSLKIQGLFGSKDFYNKLKSLLYKNFIEKVTTTVIKEVLPIVTKVVHQADMCSYFDAKSRKTKIGYNFYHNNDIAELNLVNYIK